jgi:hypothetical protein
MYTDLGSRRLALLRASSTVSNHSRVLAMVSLALNSSLTVILTLGAVNI